MLIEEHASQQQRIPLSVARYDAQERSVMPDLCNRVIACSSAVTFARVDYPIHVRDDVELARYVDVMQEGRFDHYFDLLHGLTEEEFALFERINRCVAEFTESRYSRRRVAGAALLSSMYVFRHLRALYPAGSTILELGPGCGYLGALLVLSGYAYVSSDIAQAFYVFQNHLLQALIGDALIELAVDPGSLAEISSIAPGTAVHVPWWKYVVPRPAVAFAIDCVTPNHMLCEMSNVALSYNLRFWSQLGADIVFDDWGSQISVPAWVVAKRLSETGYVFAYADERLYALVPQTSLAAAGASRLPHAEHTPTEHFINLKNYGESGFARIYRPPVAQSLANPHARKIIENQRLVRAGRTIGADHARSLLTSILGTAIETADERFFEFIGHPH